MLYHLTKLKCLEELANFSSGHLETILDNLLHVQTSKQRKKYNQKNQHILLKCYTMGTLPNCQLHLHNTGDIMSRYEMKLILIFYCI